MTDAVEIKPEVPVIRLQPRAAERIAASGFFVDPAAGTVRHVNEGAGRASVDALLPHRSGSPTAGDRPTLARVVVVTLPQATILIRLLVLLDERGHVLATTPQSEAAGFDAMWPAGRLEQLRAYGVAVEQDSCRDRRVLQQRYPGSARWWWVTTSPWSLIPFGLAWALVILLIVLVVA